MKKISPSATLKRPEIQFQAKPGTQFELDFEAGLLERWPEWDECIRDSLAACGRQQRAVAADLDMSPSELSRKLARRHADRGDEPHFPLERFPDLLEAMGNVTPILWLVERFCDSPEARRRKNRERLAQLLPLIERCLRVDEE